MQQRRVRIMLEKCTNTVSVVLNCFLSVFCRCHLIPYMKHSMTTSSSKYVFMGH
ncbi:hypothetical protein HanPSC8_Chr14g0631941 [Helianthus annuus]|nr:hypothetical protein HanIR_Chr14g0715061 [Helianthus annuus]KAJ0841572.1 hypothetical protein HanPSC8_Chr14g0631941 [Helianthus annuus]